MAQASSQHKLDRVRAPRIQITYDVEIGDAIQVKTLPFHLAVLGDFSGTPSQALPRLRDRSFVEVNPDNFDEVLEGMKPRVAFTVENRLDERQDAPALRVDLHFKSLEDFDAPNVARQIKPLRELLELRTKLNDLLGKLQGNDRLEELLTDVISDPEKLKKLESEIHAGDAAIAATPAPAEAISAMPEPEPVADEVETEETETVSEEPPAEVVAPEHLEAVAATESILEEPPAAEVEHVEASPAEPVEVEQVKAAAETESVAEETTAPPAAPEHLEAAVESAAVSEEPVAEAEHAAPTEAEHAFAGPEAVAPVEAHAEEAHAAPALETASATTEKPEEKKETESPAGVHATEGKLE